MLSIFDSYGRASNARLNKDKTVAISLSGQAQAVWRRTLRDTGITQWHDKASFEAVIYLGYPLTSTPSQLAAYLELVLAKVKQYAQSFSQRRLSIAGHGLVINSLLLSRVWHTIRILAIPQTFLSKLRSVAIQFLAHKAFPAVSFATCTRPRKEGGLGVLDPFDQHAALQLRWVLPLLHVEADHLDTFVLPILQYCITTVSGTADTALALGFNECHTAHLKALSPVKAMLSTATKLGLQPHFEAYGPAIVLELPILVLCPDLPRRPPEPDHSTAYQWHTLLVKDAYYFQRSLGKFRRLLPSHRGARTRLINILFQHLDTSTAHITAPLLCWFDESATTTSPQHPHIFNACQLFRSELTSGIDLNEITSKKFRHTQRTPFTDLPRWYPRASSKQWKHFWQAL
ncbi:hypothetical protein BJV82DRAFT_512157 [Fennellomyces sp. T-0311]|nr:hypothetical protein BJV82DRAFT_512157 [Fennellomyces sp. T-0311]